MHLKYKYYQDMLDRANKICGTPGEQDRIISLSPEEHLEEIRNLLGPINGHQPIACAVAVQLRQLAHIMLNINLDGCDVNDLLRLAKESRDALQGTQHD